MNKVEKLKSLRVNYSVVCVFLLRRKKQSRQQGIAAQTLSHKNMTSFSI